jgi:hypothetical protein
MYIPLNEYQKGIVRKWIKGRKASRLPDYYDTLFPEGQDEIIIPLETPTIDECIDVDLKSLLENNGYKIKDYKAGLVADPVYPKRELSVMKVLKKLKASDYIMDKFINDPARSSTPFDVDKYRIVISKNPFAIAAASTGRSWVSCMTMPAHEDDEDEGDNYEYLGNEIRAGSLIAYLVRSDDLEGRMVVGRVLLKPYHLNRSNDPNAFEQIAVPEQCMYGEQLSQFEYTVKKWCERSFLKPGFCYIYNKDDQVYDDDGEGQYIRIDGDGVVDFVYDEPVDSGDRWNLFHQNFTGEQILELFNRLDNRDDEHGMNILVSGHNTRDPEVFNTIWNHGNGKRRANLIYHTGDLVKSDLIDQYLQETDNYCYGVLSLRHITLSQVKKVLSKYWANLYFQRALASNPFVGKDTVDYMIKNFRQGEVLISLIERETRKLQSDQIDAVINKIANNEFDPTYRGSKLNILTTLVKQKLNEPQVKAILKINSSNHLIMNLRQHHGRIYQKILDDQQLTSKAA